MAFLDKMQSAAKSAGDKASDAIELAKLKNSVNSKNKEVEIALTRIGQIYYDLGKSGECELTDDAKELLGKIDDKKAEIADLNKSIAVMTGK